MLTATSFKEQASDIKTWYLDFDNDGHYLNIIMDSVSPGLGWRLDGTAMGDCDDTNPFIYQSAMLYHDFDFDGYDAGQTLVCYGNIIPVGYSTTTMGSDCNDNDATVHEANTTWYLDADHDGYYVNTTTSCTYPGAGWTLLAGISGDCDGYYVNTTTSCTSPGAGWNTTSTIMSDCDDNNAAVTSTITVDAITGADKVCIGVYTQLSNTTVGGTWSVDNTNASINSTGLLGGINAGNVTVTYTVTSGTCSNSTTKVVTVNAPPVVTDYRTKFSLCWSCKTINRFSCWRLLDKHRNISSIINR